MLEVSGAITALDGVTLDRLYLGSPEIALEYLPGAIVAPPDGPAAASPYPYMIKFIKLADENYYPGCLHTVWVTR